MIRTRTTRVRPFQPWRRVLHFHLVVGSFRKGNHPYDTHRDPHHHHYPPAATTSTSTSSLLHFVRDDDDDDDTASDNTDEGGENNNPHHASTNTTTVELLHQHERQDGHTTIHPSLDRWIEEPVVSLPSHYYSPRPPPSIILPSFSTNHQSCSSQRAPRISKQQKPLIVEMDDAPTTRGATNTYYTNTNITLSVTDRTNAAVEPYRPTDNEINSNVEQIIDATTYQQQQQQTTNVPTPNDIQQYTNTVSIFLSKLGRSIHSSSNTNHPNNSQQHDETRDISVIIGLGTVVNTRTEALVQSFMTRHYLSGTTTKRELLDNVLWKMILEPIAQDYTMFIQSRNYRTNKKRSSSRSTTNCISPSLTLGLGMLQFHTPMGVAYDSLLRLLQRLVLPPHMEMSNNAGSNQDSQLKEQKILALGAIYLLRCRIRCINLSLTHLETGFVVVVDASHSDSPKGSRRRQTTLNTLEPELEILLSKLLPCLESIVSGSSASSTNGQTVLNSAAADACFELIEISSRFALCHQRLPNNPSGTNNEAENVITDSMTIWNGVLPCIGRLLMTKQRWIMSSAMSDRCATAVIIDWIDVLTSAKRLYFDYLVGDGLLEGCDCSAAMNLFVNLSGILMRRADEEDDSTKMTYLRVGGIVQSLCQHKECIFGSISSPIYGSDIDVVSLLQESSKLTDDIRARNKDSTSVDTFTIINHQRAAVRAFASWISSSTKAIRILTESKRNTEADVDLLDSSMGSLILMLRSESKQCVDLCIASL